MPPDRAVAPHAPWGVPEHLFARSVFGPLGGIVEIGAVAATGTWSLTDTSVGVLAATHRDDVARLLELIREIGDFGAPAMEIFDDLGHLREHPVHVSSLLLWSSGYEDVSPELEEPAAVRRMSRTGADLQLAQFLQALTEAVIARGPDASRGAELIAEAVRIAVGLLAGALDDDPVTAPKTAFRLWRVAFLNDLLLPGSPAHPDARRRFREYGHALETLLAP
ncbi:hypothetical protein AB0N81_39700 [Streptomyces sp. NPDC093510]|uniref:hypothetical protein n=1 Tax=Streptomyces sp. NPDC093510 TaxID=3155199 RepID=UPI00342A6EA6